jgi:ATP-dependent Lon protease
MTQSYPVLPLRDIVVFPQMIVPLFVGRDKSVAALETAMAADKQIFLVSQLDPAEDDPDRDALYDLGGRRDDPPAPQAPRRHRPRPRRGPAARLARLHGHGGRSPRRRRELSSTTDEPEGAEVSALMRSVVEQFESYSKLNKKLPAETAVQLGQIEEPSRLADAVAANINIKVSDKQTLLAELNPVRRSKWPSPSWRASSACSRSRRRSARASSARWRRPSANTISTSS